MHSAPGTQSHVSIPSIFVAPLSCWLPPGRWCLANKLRSVPFRSPTGWCVRGIRIETSPGAQSNQQTHGFLLVFPCESHLHRILSRIHRVNRLGSSLALALLLMGADLLDRDLMDRCPGNHPAHSHRRGPTRTVFRDLDQPGVVPSRHNRLPVRVPIRMMVLSAFRAGFRITSGPHPSIDGIPFRLGFPWVVCHHLFPGAWVHRASVERIVEASPFPLKRGATLTGAGTRSLGAVTTASRIANWASRRQCNRVYTWWRKARSLSSSLVFIPWSML